MKIGTVNWKKWKCKSHIDNAGKIIIDNWISPGQQPTTVEIQQASDDYDVYIANQQQQNQADYAFIKARIKQKLNLSEAEFDKYKTVIRMINMEE